MTRGARGQGRWHAWAGRDAQDDTRGRATLQKAHGGAVGRKGYIDERRRASHFNLAAPRTAGALARGWRAPRLVTPSTCGGDGGREGGGGDGGGSDDGAGCPLQTSRPEKWNGYTQARRRSSHSNLAASHDKDAG